MVANLCPYCRSPNRPGSHVCSACGKPLRSAPLAQQGVQCPNCQANVRAGAAFCPVCGSNLAAQTVRGPGLNATKLVIRRVNGQSEEHPLPTVGGTITIGRDTANDIVLNIPTVSGRHLKLDVAPSGVLVTDLGSRNGTYINGQQIPPHIPHPLQPGDVIRVSDLTGNFVRMSLETGDGSFTQTRLLGLHGIVTHGQIRIGRDPSCDIHLNHPSVSRYHAEIVRRNGDPILHDLGSTNGTFLNGQRIVGWVPLHNGDVINIGPYKLVFDGRIQGLTTFASRGHRLDAIGLGIQIPKGPKILSDVSLSVQPCEFVALVGGSGAGKTTLLKAMNGYNRATEGYMLVDGQDLYANLDIFRPLMGYVPQDDIIHQQLPVRLALWYAAKLRLPDTDDNEIKTRIAKVLSMLDLSRHAEKPVRILSGGQRKRVSIAVELLAEPSILFLDEPTSGLDPGLEKKMMYDLNQLADQGRTIVLVTHATANIEQCDCVAFLAFGHLAYYGPPREAISYFQVQDFADIYLKLSQPTIQSSVPPPPAQSPLSLIPSGAQPGGASAGIPAGPYWAAQYKRSPQCQKFVYSRQQALRSSAGAQKITSPPKPARDSVLRQIGILARRHLDLIRHDMRTLFILLIMMPIIALLFAMVSHKTDLTGKGDPTVIKEELCAALATADIGASEDYMPVPTASRLLTMLGLALTQAGTFGAAYEIVKERAIFKRERAVNLRVSAYILAKVLVLGLFAIFQVFSVLLILGLKVDLNFEPIFDFFPSGSMELFVTTFLGVLASIMFGLFISAAVPNTDTVLYIILIQLFVQIIFSGTLFPLPKSSATEIASKAVISYWTMDAMGATVDIRGRLNKQSWVCTKIEIPKPDGSRAIECSCKESPMDEKDIELPYEHTEKHLLGNWIALLIQTVIWGALVITVQARKRID